MFRTLKRGGLVVGVLGALGIIGAGCLTRPVESTNPDTKTNFTAVVHNQAVDKLDLLFMIDNSASMGDKQALLAAAVPDMITRLVSPFCLDGSGNYTTTHVDAMGNCPMGDTAEFPPVHDMHLGIVTSSLGARGGDVAGCQPADTNPANPSLSGHGNDNGELINRGGAPGDPTVEMPVGDAMPDNFLYWYPSNGNSGMPMPGANPITTVGAAGSGGLIGDFAEMIEGVHEHGCGFEAQNEAWYRFLVQPDPFAADTVASPHAGIVVNGNKATLNGIDATILAQRAAFLRPDSLVAVIVVTDENEEVANPLSIGGQGWAFENTQFPGSPNGAAPQGTIECTKQDPNNPSTTGPNDPNCTSCAFNGLGSNAQRCPKDGNAGQNGYLDPADDSLNVRFFNQKIRFGLFAGYPTSRYLRGLTQTTVPDSAHEVDKNGNYIGDQSMNADCVNPLFAQTLPTDPTKDLCHLTRGPRTPDLVYYAAIVGVPHQLLQAQPGTPDCAAGTAAGDCPQKSQLSDADWTLIGGKDPEHYDFTGSDFHMIESENPRTTQGANGSATVWANVSSCPPSSADDCDKDSSGNVENGREWNTNKGDLQFACIFDLRPQFGGVGKDCTQAKYSGACDCAQAASGMNGSNTAQTQLCAKDGSGNYTSTQIYGKAYPSVRETIIAHKMGNQGIISSLCPIHVTDNSSGSDPLYGYRPAVKAIVDRLKNSLSNQCLPQTLTADSCGNVPCLILVTLPASQNGEQDCTNAALAPGMSIPPADILQKFQQQQHDQWVASGSPAGIPDPSTLPTCALNQLTQPPPGAPSSCTAPPPNTFDNTGSCAASSTQGWCYVTGAAAKGCPQAILFTNSEPPHGSTVSLQCIESTVSPLGDGGGGGDAGGGG